MRSESGKLGENLERRYAQSFLLSMVLFDAGAITDRDSNRHYRDTHYSESLGSRNSEASVIICSYD